LGALANQSFVKMNGIGNEIVVVDLRLNAAAIAPEEARAAAKAEGGAPYDQLMALYPPRTPGTDAFIRIYNNDGSESGACGNGIRCVADLIAKERSIAEQKAAESGKPAEIVAKMVDGSVQKYLKEVSLLNQTFVKNDKQTIEQMLKAANSAVQQFALFVVGEGIEKRQDDFAAEVAAQVAAAKQQ